MLKPFICAVALLLSVVGVANAEGEGKTDFIARPKIGTAHLTLPSHLTWQASTAVDGSHRVALSLIVDVNSVLKNIHALSAAALDKDKKCGDLLAVRGASAKLLSPTTISYDLRFHYAKRICTGGGIPLELPADVACSAVIAISGQGSELTVDIHGANAAPCSIDGSSSGIATFASKKVFKTHKLDLTQQLPLEFQGITVNVRSLAFDTPPEAPRLHISGEASMSDQEFKAFMAKATAVTRAVHK